MRLIAMQKSLRGQHLYSYCSHLYSLCNHLYAFYNLRCDFQNLFQFLVPRKQSRGFVIVDNQIERVD